MDIDNVIQSLTTSCLLTAGMELLLPWNCLNFSTDPTRCSKLSPENCVPIDMMASRSCYRCFGCTDLLFHCIPKFDWDLVALGVIWVQWTRHVQETSLAWFELGALSCWRLLFQYVCCDRKGMDAISNNTMVFKCYSAGTKELKAFKENIPHAIKPPTPAWTIDKS